MAGSKQYGLKIVHRPSREIVSERWFNTALERDDALREVVMAPYVVELEEKEIHSAEETPEGQWGGPV